VSGSSFSPQSLSNYVVDPRSICSGSYTALTIQFSYTSQGINSIRYICNDNQTTTSTNTTIISSGATTLPDNSYKIIQFNNDAITNPTIQDGYCYTRSTNNSIIDSTSITTNEEFKKALNFLYSYNMTRFRSIDEFLPYQQLTREQAAKILSNFAINVLCRKPDFTLSTNYTDTVNGDPSLKSYITLAYQL
jgi:hypothetical protein